MGKEILLTGSSGYIGSSLARQLVEAGHTVHGIDRDGSNGEVLSSMVDGDLLAPDTFDRAPLEVDCIFHLAAARGDWGISEDEYYRNNVEATQRLIEVGTEAGVTDWVFFSTVSAMGPSEEAEGEDAPLEPIGPYGGSKAEAERLFRQLAEENPEARVLIIRPSVVYGPGNPPDTNIYRLIDAIYNRRFAMVGPGEALKSTSYLENLLAATFFLWHRLERGVQTYIYVDEPVLTTGTLVERIYRLLGRKPPSWHVPLSIAEPVAYFSDLAAAATGIDFPITAARIDKFNRSTNFDGSKIREAGFNQPISNEEALQATVEWHLHHEYGEALP